MVKVMRWVAATLAIGIVVAFGDVRSAAAQTATPLSLSNNYMVTGDYVVGGVGLRGLGDGSGFATGTINIPDPGAYASNVSPQQVPAGADIVAAFLYWETVESSGTFAGQNGFFRGYPITGLALGNPNAPVSWSSGGCAGSSQGSKTMVAYRADVSGVMPVDANGNVQPNTSYTVRLADSGKSGNVPFTLGATLVIIYRLLAPSAPLNAVVIYDGAYAPSNASQILSQPIVGFFQAGNDQAAPIATKITQIVGNGQSNKIEQVYLNNYDGAGDLVHSTLLPSIYGTNPAFPGNYNGSWDNPTWFPNAYATTPAGATTVEAGESSETALVLPSASNKGCVSWGAIVLSTTVQDSDHDGLLDVWKAKQGYCDAGAYRGMTNQGTCPLSTADPSWVDLTGARSNQKDVFVQLDYMCGANADGRANCDPNNGGISYQPDPQAVSDVTNAFSANGHAINVHIDPNSHVIPQQACADNTAVSPPQYCPFPGQAGVVGWKAGFEFLKSQPLNYPDETSCETQTPTGGSPGTGPPCVRRFQPGRRNSYHEVIFGNAAAVPSWSFIDGSLTSVAVSGNTVTLNTLNPHGLVPDPTDSGIPNGRVTISDAISNPNLNNTYLVQSVPTPTSFTIQVVSATTAPTQASDPYLSVASGSLGTGSGISDVGGADALVSLGLWGADGRTVPVESGTLMHELGHSLGLTHGGYSRAPDPSGTGYDFTFEPNCKPNFQSVMNYLFQVDLLDGVLDYSEQVLSSVDESNASQPGGLGNAIHPSTKWYAPNQPLGTPATSHCDGTPLLRTDQPMYRLEGATSPTPGLTSIAWSAGQDVNFDGKIETTLSGYNDWDNIDLRQTGASANDFWAGGIPKFGGGIPKFGGGIPKFGGGIPKFGGGIPKFGGGVGDMTFQVANSSVRVPSNPGATLTSSNTVQLIWTPPTFAQSEIAAFNIYRAVNGAAFGQVPYATVPVTGTPLPLPTSFTFTDAKLGCGTYAYAVTTVLSDGRESVLSSTTSAISICSPTSTTVTSSVNPSIFGQMVTFTATVTNLGTSAATPTGSVQFNIDGAAFGQPVQISGSGTTATGNSGATATLTVNGSPHTIQAVYTNTDGYFSGSSGTLGQTVNPAPTSTAVSSSVDPSVVGQPVTFTVTVTNIAGAAVSTTTPTGSVQFMDGSSLLGAPQAVNSSGRAALTTSALTAGTHPITAVYTNMDGNFTGSTSTSINQVVQDFSITATPSDQTIPSGHQAIYTITVTPLTGLTGSIALTCGGAPPNSTCSVSPSTDNLQGSPVASTVTLYANKNVNHGTFTLTFTGALVGSNLTHGVNVQLTVK